MVPGIDVAARIRQFNQGRRADGLALKYARLRKSAWGFFRGTGHLFYAAAPLPPSLADAPLAGLCGDLHLENFGAYRGDSGQACFSVNDFDDALEGPLAWDLARFTASLFVAVAYLRRPAAEAETLAADFLGAYAQALAAGGAALPDEALIAGPIGAILRAFPAASVTGPAAYGADLLPNGRQINLDQKHFLLVTHAERAMMIAQVAEFGRLRPDSKAFQVWDVARLAAGTSSLGLERYAVLAGGQGAARLLEIKEAAGSCAAPYLQCRQPVWPTQAARVVAAQRRFQAVPPALLGTIGDAARSYVVRDYAPARHRLSLDDPGVTGPALAATVRTLARVVAGGHLRGAFDTSALADFAQNPAWRTPLIDFARARAEESQVDCQEYCRAYDGGELS